MALLTTIQPAAAAPKRVMSLNVCTDQLAMELAAPGQLVSVSYLAGDPGLSFLHEKAGAYPKNRGRAEEVFLDLPDLVVTGTYTLHNTTQLLKKLDFEVAEFPFTQTIATIPGDIRRMGRLLGREQVAEQKATAFERQLKEAEKAECGPAPTAVTLQANGVTSGSGTLADSVLQAAGYHNLAADLGFSGVTPFPLELLVTHQPDVVIVPAAAHDAPALADLIPRHPAIAALDDTRVGAFVPAGSWNCGGPFTIHAVEALVRLRAQINHCGAAGAEQ